MKLKIEIGDKVLEKSIDILDFTDKKSLDDIILEFLNNEIYTTDILFLLLQKLSEDDKIISDKNEIVKKENFSEGYKKELFNYLKKKIEKLTRKIFLTPLEISKFYQCQRRFFLEKVVHSKQKKSDKSLEGEVLHKSISSFIKNYAKYAHNLELLVLLVVDKVLSEYKGKISKNRDEVIRMLYSIDNLIKKFNFKYVVSEPLLISIKYGIVGTPDIIAITQKNEVLPIELKTNVKKIKMGLKIQLIGEAFVVESFFRKEINEIILLSLSNRKIFKVKITDEDKRMIQNMLKSVKRLFLSKKIPPLSNLPNFRKVVCPYCHVKEVCDFIEEINKTIRISK